MVGNWGLGTGYWGLGDEGDGEMGESSPAGNDFVRNRTAIAVELASGHGVWGDEGDGEMGS